MFDVTRPFEAASMPVVPYLRKDRHTNSAGFTLAELMVVITIAALLSALLLPALATAKEKTRRAVCKSNIREVLFALENYAEENSDFLPTSADNRGSYHSIILSDETFSNLVLLTGNSKVFYCPNMVFGDVAGPIGQHDPKYGYVIGYSYWAGTTIGTPKGPDYLVLPSKMTDSKLSTNALVSDANYWTLGSGDTTYFPTAMTLSPHGAAGPALVKGSSLTLASRGSPTNSASIGAQGGNAGYSDVSVQWRNISAMQTLPASSMIDAYGNR
jgi:prepilin-type N-terminal cleavage/methylation domain-containing protein